MTLKEKLEQEKLYINPYNFKLTKEGVENFEKIADDYAIEFLLYLSDWHNKKRAKELLEIFKKEKGL